MTRYMRVKNKQTRHEFDLPTEMFDSKRYEAVKSDRYPERSRPRRGKPSVPIATKTVPVKADKE